jgi:hypothetical protein
MVLDLDDEAVHRIAGESASTVALRKSLTERLEILTSGRRDLMWLGENHRPIIREFPHASLPLIKPLGSGRIRDLSYLTHVDSHLPEAEPSEETCVEIVENLDESSPCPASPCPASPCPDELYPSEPYVSEPDLVESNLFSIPVRSNPVGSRRRR